MPSGCFLFLFLFFTYLFRFLAAVSEILTTHVSESTTHSGCIIINNLRKSFLSMSCRWTGQLYEEPSASDSGLMPWLGGKEKIPANTLDCSSNDSRGTLNRIFWTRFWTRIWIPCFSYWSVRQEVEIKWLDWHIDLFFLYRCENLGSFKLRRKGSPAIGHSLLYITVAARMMSEIRSCHQVFSSFLLSISIVGSEARCVSRKEYCKSWKDCWMLER